MEPGLKFCKRSIAADEMRDFEADVAEAFAEEEKIYE